MRSPLATSVLEVEPEPNLVPTSVEILRINETGKGELDAGSQSLWM
jgi:hypothetical protein